MKLKSLFVTCILAGGCLSTAWAQQPNIDDPMTRAMMEVYNQEITANPKAYDVYFRRANEYYKFNQYLRALADIDNAIKYAPTSDSDFLFSCHSLRGDIYQMLGKPFDALEDYTTALKYDPSSFMALYQKANCEYELGRYDEAKADFTRLRSLNGRSAEALTGLARIAVKENNLGLASEYMDDAVAMMPSDSDIYVRRSSVRRMLGNNTGAVDDLLMAISIDNSPKAFQQLIEVSRVDYPAVITALSNAVHQAPDQGMFYYIRGVIAQAHDHYPSAIADYQKIIDENMYNYAGIYGSLAECHLALCNFSDALSNVNQAIGMTDENGEYQITLAKIYRAQGRNNEALKAINSALEKMPYSEIAKAEKGKILFSLEQYDEASNTFGELIMDNPDQPMNHLLRAWTFHDSPRKTSEARGIYMRMLDLNVDNSKVASMYGFTLLFIGKKAEAIKWMDDILLENRDTDGTTNYIAACLYAQAGETEKAFNCLEDALNKGYSNRYNITQNNDARVNVAPLRSGDKLNTLLAKYSYIFE